MSFPQPLPIVLKAEEIVPVMRQIISKYDAVRQNIVETVNLTTATFETVVRPCAEVENAVQGQLDMIYMQQYASPDPNTQEAFNEAQKLHIEAEATWTA